MSKIPVVCDLSALPNRDHHERITETLFTQTITLTETDTGYQVELPITAFKLASEFVDGERRCCPFLHFELIIVPAADVLQLRIKGDDEAKALLQNELLSRVGKDKLSE